MKRFAIAAVVALAVALGFAAMSATQDSVSAQETGRVSIECTETQVPDESNGWIGEVTCTLTVDMSDLPVPEPEVYTLTLLVQYEDLDQSGSPTFGDRLLCWEIPDLGVGTC